MAGRNPRGTTHSGEAGGSIDNKVFNPTLEGNPPVPDPSWLPPEGKPKGGEVGHLTALTLAPSVPSSNPVAAPRPSLQKSPAVSILPPPTLQNSHTVALR